LHKLAEDGDIEAQFQLAQRYEHGIGGVKRDAQAALLWYRRAAAAGHPTAKKALEQMSAQPGSTN
jgi:TPR repeat protein